MRLIDADALKKEIDDYWNPDMAVSEIWGVIDNAPTVDAVLVKHGRWIVDTKFGNDVLSGGKMVICSRCGKGGRFDGGSPYCSNCGAKMDGGNTDGATP